MPDFALLVPTADDESEPARSSLRRLRETTRHLSVVVRPVVSSGPGFSFARSVNRGLRDSAGAKAVVLVNDDCMMDPGWLDALIGLLEHHEDVGVGGAVLRYPTGGVQHAGGRVVTGRGEFLARKVRALAPFDALRAILRPGRPFYPYLTTHYRRVHPGQRLDFVTGACLLMSRACLSAVGTFDERFPLGYEDVDFCLRALRAGFEIGLATDAGGVHLEGATTAHLGSRRAESLRMFHARWSRQEICDLMAARSGAGVYHPLSCEGGQPR